jgi:hypothetical protein
MPEPLDETGTRFWVTRTSTKYTYGYGDGEECPVKGAVLGTRETWDVRTFKSAEEHDAKIIRERWLARGTEHQTVYGPRGGVQGIKRRLGDVRAWFIRLDTLDDLMAFIREHGEVVMGYEDGTQFIEIYDNYRE